MTTGRKILEGVSNIVKNLTCVPIREQELTFIDLLTSVPDVKEVDEILDVVSMSLMCITFFVQT